MKKRIVYFSTVLLTVILLLLSVFLNSSYSEFQSSNVKSTISILSSDTFNGRLAGSTENAMAAEVIKNEFEKNGLTPYKGSYFENFTVTTPVSTGTSPYLKIFKDGNVEEDFQYGVDFKEDMINFKNNTFSFSKDDKVTSFNNYIEVVTSSGKFMMYVPATNDFSFRSSFLSDFPYDAIIMLTVNTKNKILKAIDENKTVNIHIPFTTEEKSISNVVGVIEGKDSSKAPFIITAHFDHLGKDGLGNQYSGALDNASGTAFMLEIQRTLSTYGKPDRDIIFVALNAEEFGLLGSKYFAENNYFDIKGATVINFDMIGSADFPITFMQGTTTRQANSPLLDTLKSLCDKKGVKYEVTYEDSSDHASFNRVGLDAVSFCHSDKSKIHTPKDTLEYINTNAIDSVYTVVNKLVKAECYSTLTVFAYSRVSIFILSFILLILIVAPIVIKRCYGK